MNECQKKIIEEIDLPNIKWRLAARDIYYVPLHKAGEPYMYIDMCTKGNLVVRKHHFNDMVISPQEARKIIKEYKILQNFK